MLEEKNDNLLEADGNVADESQEVNIAENQEISVENQEKNEPVMETATEEVVETVAEQAAPEAETETVEDVAEVEAPTEPEVALLTEELTEDEIEVAADKEALVEETVEIVAEPEKETEEVVEAATIVEVVEVETANAEVLVEEVVEVALEETSVEENTIELTDEQVADDTIVVDNDKQSAINAIEEVNAEESEDETLKDRHDIPMLDYDTLSMEQLIDELSELVVVEKLMSVKDHVEELKKAFLSKYYHFIDEKKEEFHAENPETTEDFQYHFPLKAKFDQLYSQYRDKKNNHFQSLQNNLKSNLENRLAIVEELKNLIHSQDNIPVTLKKFNDIRDRWKVAGPIPKDK